MSVISDLTGYTLANSYVVLKRIGTGGFGQVYLAENKEKDAYGLPSVYALKIEDINSSHQLLNNEEDLYQTMNGIHGIPYIWATAQDESCNILAMELLGANLENLFEFCNRRFSNRTVLLLVDQLLTRLESVHRRGIIHNDLKPENILLDINPLHLEKVVKLMTSEDFDWSAAVSYLGTQVFVVDFGLSTRYLDDKGQHIKCSKANGFSGTLRFASPNAHRGMTLSRRDDLISLGYTIAYLLEGTLPWLHAVGQTMRDKRRWVYAKKKSTSVDTLFAGYAVEFKQFMRYALSLEFEQGPDYKLIRNMVKPLLQEVNPVPYEKNYDWNGIGHPNMNTSSVRTSSMSSTVKVSTNSDESGESSQGRS